MSLVLILLAGLPDLPAPLGQLDGVLERPTKSAGVEQVVDVTLPGCGHPVPLNVSRVVAGTAFAMQQMVDWMKQTPELVVLTPAQLDELGAAVREGAGAESRACKALPRDVTQAPRLCPGKGASEAWVVAKGKPAALVRWRPATGKDKCVPALTSVLFDAKGVARVRYDADFGAAAGGALLGDTCKVTFTYDPAKEVFHAAGKGCKGP